MENYSNLKKEYDHLNKMLTELMQHNEINMENYSNLKKEYDNLNKMLTELEQHNDNSLNSTRIDFYSNPSEFQIIKRADLRKLEEGDQAYSLILNSKIFKSTRHLRKIYFYILILRSKKMTNLQKLHRINQYLKSFPRLRNFAIKIYHTFNLQKFLNGRIVAMPHENQYGNSERILKANSLSFERSLQLKRKS